MRETFAVVIVTNLIVLFPLFKTWIAPLFRSPLRLLSHQGWSTASQREKDLEKQVGGSRNNGGRHQGRRTLSLIPPTTRETAETSMWPVRLSRVAGPHGTPAKAFNMRLGGSRAEIGAGDNEIGGRSVHERDFGHKDETALNRTEGRGLEGIIAPVPPCRIRKDVNVSVQEEGPTTSSSFGNFTSAWGPERKRPGPDLPLEMRTPYLADHLHQAAPGTWK